MASVGGSSDPEHDGLIVQFCETTGTSPAEATQYLAAHEWDINTAASAFFAAQDPNTEAMDEDAEEAPEDTYTGPRTLDGRPAPEFAGQPAKNLTASKASSRKTGVAGIATLGSLANKADEGHGHAHDDSGDDTEDDDHFSHPQEPRDLFAGGEKSGLAVQDPNHSDNNPKKLVNDIIKQAKANAKRGGLPATRENAPVPSSSRFHGSGQTLGGDDTPSAVVPESSSSRPASTPVSRILHLWNDGFSVEDGPLRRFDDASNAADLAMIRSGRAPVHLMGVQPGQTVDVQLQKHDEDYKAPPKAYKPFGSEGRRLGSPTPGPSTSSAEQRPSASEVTTAPSTSTPTTTIDSSLPTLSLRIQLADGSRLPVRFNTTQTIGDVYDFIAQASGPNPTGRAWVLATTFPSKDHTDKSLVLGEVAEFKRGGTAVQKWI